MVCIRLFILLVIVNAVLLFYTTTEIVTGIWGRRRSALGLCEQCHVAYSCCFSS